MTAFKFGDNVDTDIIAPGKYLNLTEPEELAAICMEGIDPQFHAKVTPGDIIVAGKNFGCGSSREHAPISLKAVGIGCVIAESFARIFYRNAINIGLPVLESPEAARAIKEGDEVSIDFDRAIIQHITANQEFAFKPFSESVTCIITAGGLGAYIQFKKGRSEKA